MHCPHWRAPISHYSTSIQLAKTASDLPHRQMKGYILICLLGFLAFFQAAHDFLHLENFSYLGRLAWHTASLPVSSHWLCAFTCLPWPQNVLAAPDSAVGGLPLFLTPAASNLYCSPTVCRPLCGRLNNTGKSVDQGAYLMCKESQINN